MLNSVASSQPNTGHLPDPIFAYITAPRSAILASMPLLVYNVTLARITQYGKVAEVDLG